MITADPTGQTPAQLGDAIGYTALVFVVIVVIAFGFVSLIQWRDRHKPGNSFADDYIPDRFTVAATEKEKKLPQLRLRARDERRYTPAGRALTTTLADLIGSTDTDEGAHHG